MTEVIQVPELDLSINPHNIQVIFRLYSAKRIRLGLSSVEALINRSRGVPPSVTFTRSGDESVAIFLDRIHNKTKVSIGSIMPK